MTDQSIGKGIAPLLDPAEPEVRAQFAALCYRTRRGQMQVLLVTSRDTGRWVLPKGWPASGLTPAQSAAREAWEEAGAKGRISLQSIGSYPYLKQMLASAELFCHVEVFAMRVETIAGRFPEKHQRKRRWFGVAEAADSVQETDLKALILGFPLLPPLKKTTVR